MVTLQERRGTVEASTRNGYILWEGESLSDGKPIVMVATALKKPSANPKTGPMAQVLLLRSDVSPDVAVTTGEDESVCNGCELRQYTVKKEAREKNLSPGEKPPMCYVSSHYFLNSVYRGLQRGIYPFAPQQDFPRLFKGKRVRLGAYGNFSNATQDVTEAIVGAAKGHTLYEHDWANERATWMAPYAMASVSSEEGKAEANRLGWRTFRVKRPGERKFKDELVCPASEEAGKKTTCYDCLLCNGNSRKAKNIVIDDHGPTSGLVQKKLLSLKLIER